MKSYTQLLYFLRALKQGQREFDELDDYYPFYVDKDHQVILSSRKKYRFKEQKVFESIAQLSKFVVANEGTVKTELWDDQD